jgi:hypothetical protein
MASRPPPDGPEQHRAPKKPRSSYKWLIHTPCRAGTQPPSSSSGSSVGVQSRAPSPSPSGTPNQTAAAQSIPCQTPNPAGPSAGPSRAGANPAGGATNVTSATNPKPTTLGKAKKAGKAAWTGLEGALNALHITSKVFPPLQSAIGEVIGCLDIVQVGYHFTWQCIPLTGLVLRRQRHLVTTMRLWR